MRCASAWSVLALALAGCAAVPPAPRLPESPDSAVVGVESRHLGADFWIERARAPERVYFSAAGIAEQNARTERLDPSMYDLAALPAALPRDTARDLVEGLSSRPDEVLYDEQGRELGATALDALADGVALDAIPATRQVRYGLVVRRADLRRFPTRARAFDEPDDLDIDRFQESAAFPGTAVAIAHESRDGLWWFVITANYAAWLEKQFVAVGDAKEVLAYQRKAPFLVVTGARAATVHTRERPDASELQLDMGVRLPLLADWPAERPVNGQLPQAAWVVELPLRAVDGSLGFAPALVPKTADVKEGYLPLTSAALLNQAFKFLGERYGWGHSNNARDCSGFVSDVYRSFGIDLPRNSGAQGTSPALNRVAFSDSDARAARMPALRDLKVGDLVYIPGHVMMVIGRDHGAIYVIHDTTGANWRAHDGTLKRTPLNGVVVTPLEPLLLGDGRSYVDGIYSIQRIRPQESP